MKIIEYSNSGANAASYLIENYHMYNLTFIKIYLELLGFTEKNFFFPNIQQGCAFALLDIDPETRQRIIKDIIELNLLEKK